MLDGVQLPRGPLYELRGILINSFPCPELAALLFLYRVNTICVALRLCIYE